MSLAAVAIIVGLLGRDAQQDLGRIALGLYDQAFMSMSYLRSAQNALLETSRDIVLGTAEPDALADRLDGAADDLTVARDRAMSPAGKRQADLLRSALAQLAADLRRGGALPARESLDALRQSFDETVEVYAGDAFRSRRAAVAVVRRTSLRTWAAIAIAIAVAIAITTALSRAIVPSVRRAVAIATAIAAGQLDNRIESRSRSETGVLLRALSAMQASIADKIARIEALMSHQADSYASEIASQHDRFEAALNNMTHGLCMFDRDERLLVHNRRFAEMFGLPSTGGNVIESLPLALQPGPADCDVRSRMFTRSLDDGRVIAVSMEPMKEGGHVATYEDVTERRRAELQMQHMARHDSLTGLPNRLLFREHLDHDLLRARHGSGVAVLCLDLDRFKTVNDTLGHPAGDVLLREAAQRLLAEIREDDMVVRLGGDEFAVIQAGSSQPSSARAMAERLIASLNRPFTIDGHVVSIGVSIGIATAVGGRDNADVLLKSADLALYRAKAEGRGTFRFFETEMDVRMQARRQLELDLRSAVADEQFEVHYQPLISTSTGEVNGFEALVRWRHPDRGMVSPAEFIPVAEETGLIDAIGLWVLNCACRDAVEWPSAIKVAVNLSPLQFRSPDLAGDVRAALNRSGLLPQRLELEITESLLLQDSEATLGLLHKIRALGVRISMDDFGTGYSSLSYLRRFPFDKIKIDQSFIRQLEDRDDCMAIVRAVVGLGRSLGMSVIAEGVETTEQLELLRREGCQQVQGYLFSRPRPVSAVMGLIASCARPAEHLDRAVQEVGA